MCKHSGNETDRAVSEYFQSPMWRAHPDSNDETESSESDNTIPRIPPNLYAFIARKNMHVNV